MLRRFLIAAPMLIVALLGIDWGSSFFALKCTIHPVVEKDEGKYKQEQTNEQTCPPSRGIISEAIVTIGQFFSPEGWTAAATISLVIVTFILAIIGKRQIDDTKILQRAYIAAQPAGINPFLVQSGQHGCVLGHVRIVNVGRLPARDIRLSQPRAIYAEKEPSA